MESAEERGESADGVDGVGEDEDASMGMEKKEGIEVEILSSSS